MATAVGLTGAIGSAWAGPVSGTGGDTCNMAQVVDVAIGPPGSPITTVINGDNSPATGPDCPLQQPDPLWWEAFRIDRFARVTVDLCKTEPVQQPSYHFLFATCPCNSRFYPARTGRGEPGCEEAANIWMTFDALEPGTYYAPIYSAADVLLNGRGPYVLRIIAEASLGACCDPIADTCVEEVPIEQCQGATEDWSAGRSCCEAECRLPGAAYASRGVELLSHVPLDRFSSGSLRANDVWGYTSPRGREYAIIGLSEGTGFVDVTNPFDPVVVADIPDAASIWSDIAVYGHYAYNVNESGGGMQVIDLREIDDGAVSLFDSLTDSFLDTAHTIAINAASGFAYLGGANVDGGGLLAIDLADPAHPRLAGSWDEHYVHDTTVVSYEVGPYAGREIAFNFCGPAGVSIVDVTNKANMWTITEFQYPNLTYCHQGWLSPDRRYLFIDDELDELHQPEVMTTTTYVLDVSVIEEPTFFTSFTNGVCAIDHNLMVRGPHVYEANYTSGVRVYRANPPESAEEVAFFDTHPEGNAPTFDGVWSVFTDFPSGVVVTSDIERGLFVLNYDCNDNGVDDTADIAGGISVDCDGNGLPDECEFLTTGDMNRDRFVGVDDFAALLSCLLGPSLTAGDVADSYAAPCCLHADANHDGDVDLFDAGELLRGLGAK